MFGIKQSFSIHSPALVTLTLDACLVFFAGGGVHPVGGHAQVVAHLKTTNFLQMKSTALNDRDCKDKNERVLER